MARIRTIKPEFWKDEDLSELPEFTHMLAAALLNYADDEGYFNANHRLVRAECCPLREPSVSVHDALKQLASVGYLEIGDGEDGKRYGRIVGFSKHQRINRPTASKIKGLRISWEGSHTAHGAISEQSHPEQGTGNREQGKEDSSLRSESRAPALLDCGPTEPDEVGQAVADWNDMASYLNLPKVQKLNPQRKARLKARLREAGGIEGWRHALGKIRGSPFLRGERGKWSASFDFLLQEQSFTRLMEGTYDDRQPAQQDAVADRRNDITELIGERYPELKRAS